MDGDPGISFATERPSWRVEASSNWREIEIPRRRWLVPSYLMQGKVSALIGPPEAGKSTIALKWAISLALFHPFGDFNPRPLPGQTAGPYRVGTLNAEDDEDEQRRRISALTRETGRPVSDLRDNLIRIRPDHDSAKLFQPGLTGGEIMPTAAFANLERLVTEMRLDVLVLDPLVELMGGADENSNSVMGSVFATLRGMAERLGIAILVIHHVKKGGMTPGSLEAARGGGALGGSVRCAHTLAVMSEAEAEELGITKDTRRSYVRLDSAKQSYAPPADGAEWFQRFSIPLDNGETAPALEPWTPPKAREMSLDELAPIQAAIRGGTPDGLPYSARLSNDPRSLRHALVKHGFSSKQAQVKAVEAVRAAGAVIDDYRHRDAKGHVKRVAQGLRIGFLPKADWLGNSSPEVSPHADNDAWPD